jgi:hypothetical protein
MSERYGLDRWLPDLLRMFADRDREIPVQLEEVRKRSILTAGTETWTVPTRADRVLEWERDLINEIENTLFEALMHVNQADFSPSFRAILGFDIPDRPETPFPEQLRL